MSKNKSKNQEYREALKKKTLIESTAASMRLAGVDITEREVERIISEAKTGTISDKNLHKILSKKQLSVWQYLQGVDEATPGEIAKKAKVARPNNRKTLAK